MNAAICGSKKGMWPLNYESPLKLNY